MPSYIEVTSRFGDGFFKEVGRQDIIWQADFTALPLSTSSNAAELRRYLAAAGLTLTRASSATVQTSASTVVTSGIGVDDPRVGDAGFGRGLVIEEARTCLPLQSRDLNAAAWTAGSNTFTNNYATGPDGSTAVDRQVNAAGQFGKFQAFTITNGAKYVASQWARRGVIGVASTVGFYMNSSAPTFASQSFNLTDAWQRCVLPALTVDSVTGQIETCEGRAINGLSASARDAVVDLVQVEQGAFATEAIITSGATGTRATDTLAAPTLRSNGRLGFECRFIPKGTIGGANAYGGTMAIWGNSNTLADSVVVSHTTGAIVARIGGNIVLNTGLGMSWNAGDVVDFWIEMGGGSLATRAVYRVNGGTAVVLGTDTAAPAMAAAGSYLFGTSSGGFPFSAWAQRARAYAPGRRPSWAA